MKIRIEPKERDQRLYEERLQRNKSIAYQRQSVIEQEQALRSKIQECEEFVKNYEILLNVQKRLTGMLKSRGKNQKSKASESDMSNPEDLERQVIFLTKEIKGLTLKKEYLESSERCRVLQSEYENLVQEIKAIDRYLREIDAGMEEQNKKKATYNQLKMDCISK